MQEGAPTPQVIDQALVPTLLALNNADHEKLSRIDEAELSGIIGAACYAREIGGGQGVLIAFDDAADYDSLNFQWFRARYQRFIYVDRIVISAAARGRHFATILYEDLFSVAAAAGYLQICCEINLVPPNPGSHAFHEKAGFVRCGSAVFSPGEKEVAYCRRDLTATG